MKITRVIMHEVKVPTHSQRVNSALYGPAVFDEASKFIIEVHTDDGLVGLGESRRGTTETEMRCALNRLAGVELTTICLQDPPIYDLSANDMFAYEHPQLPHRLLERSFSSKPHQAIHVLLLDLLGKKAQLPAHALMGGAYRDRVRVDAWMGRMTPQDSARVCRQAKAQGYRGIKCKCALEDDNVERAQAIRDACGIDFKITFDPNERFYRPAEAITTLRQLAQVGNVGCIEDPFPKAAFSWYRQIRQLGLIPVAMHMEAFGHDFIQAIASGVCDYVNTSGMPWDIRRGADACWAARIPTWHGSGVELGILEAAFIHTAAAAKAMTLPSDILGRSIRQHNLITDPMPVTDGTVAVPAGPGLGVELDRNALEKYTLRQIAVDLVAT